MDTYVYRAGLVYDPAGASPILWWAGAFEVGTLLCGIFSSTSLGLFSGYGFNTDMGLMTMGDQFGVQFIGMIATVAFTATMTFVILKLVGLMIGGLRVEKDQEIEGLDIVLHEERGYDIL